MTHEGDKSNKGYIDLNNLSTLTSQEIKEGIIEQSRLENEIRQQEDKTKIKSVSAKIFSFENEKKRRCKKS